MHGDKLRLFRHGFKTVHHRLLPAIPARDDDAHLVIWRADAADFRHLVFAGNDNDGIHHVVVVERAKRPAQNRKASELRQNFVRSAHARARARRDDHHRTARMRELVLNLPRLADVVCQLHSVLLYVRLFTISLNVLPRTAKFLNWSNAAQAGLSVTTSPASAAFFASSTASRRLFASRISGVPF